MHQPQRTLAYSALVALLGLPICCTYGFGRQADELEREDSLEFGSLAEAFDRYTSAAGESAWDARKTHCTANLAGDYSEEPYGRVQDDLLDFDIPTGFLVDSLYIAMARQDASDFFAEFDGPDGEGIYAASEDGSCALVWRRVWGETKDGIVGYLTEATVIARARGRVYDSGNLLIAARKQERVQALRKTLDAIEGDTSFLIDIVFEPSDYPGYHMDGLLGASTRSVSRGNLQLAARAARWLGDMASEEEELAWAEDLDELAVALQTAAERFGNSALVYSTQSTAVASEIIDGLGGSRQPGTIVPPVQEILRTQYVEIEQSSRDYAALKVAEWFVDTLGPQPEG